MTKIEEKINKYLNISSINESLTFNKKEATFKNKDPKEVWTIEIDVDVDSTFRKMAKKHNVTIKKSSNGYMVDLTGTRQDLYNLLSYDEFGFTEKGGGEGPAFYIDG